MPRVSDYVAVGEREFRIMSEYRVVSYARKSKQRLSGENSIDGQVRVHQRWVEQKNRLGQSPKWRWVKAYTDGIEADASGGTMERPGLQEMIEDAKNRVFDGIIVTHVDRLSRDAKDTLTLVDQLDALGVRLHIYSMGWLNIYTAEGRLMLTNMASLSEYERAKIGMHTRHGIKQKKASGEWFGPPPYGFEVKSDLVQVGGAVKKKNTRLIPIREEIRVREEIFELSSRELTPGEIAMHLNNRGVRPRRAAKWRDSSVRSILQRPMSHFEAYIHEDDQLDEEPVELD
jgi:site-specific DNA recombinase